MEIHVLLQPVCSGGHFSLLNWIYLPMGEATGQLGSPHLQSGWCFVCLLSRVRLCDPVDRSPPVSSDYGIFPGKNTGAGCHAFLQGIFLTQGLNPCFLCLLHWLADSLPLCYGDALRAFYLLLWECGVMRSREMEEWRKRGSILLEMTLVLAIKTSETE